MLSGRVVPDAARKQPSTHNNNFVSQSIRRSVSAGRWIKSAPGWDARRANPRTTKNLTFTCQVRHKTNKRLNVRRAGAPTAGGTGDSCSHGPVAADTVVQAIRMQSATPVDKRRSDLKQHSHSQGTSEERAPSSMFPLDQRYKSWICTVPGVASLGLDHHRLHLLLWSRSSNGLRGCRQPPS